ncbi:MAG: Hsp20/alpha crystallin family protein [bacterium]
MSLFKRFKKNIELDQEDIESETEDEEIEEEGNIDEEGEEGVEEDIEEEKENEQNSETEEEIPDEEREEEKSKKKKKEKPHKDWGKKNSKKDAEAELSSSWPASKGRLAADIYETETDFCLQIPIAGVSQEDIEIFVENNMLIIRGERNEADQAPDKRYFHQECYWGPFSRNTMLPDDVNTQKILASFKKGILTIKIPRKKQESKKSSIKRQVIE